MTQDEEMLLRELAAEQCIIPKVTARLGPMSLWSKDGLDAEIRRAVEAEREACAKLLEDTADGAKNVDPKGFVWQAIKKSAELIRARGQA
jgi:hypothetical protein